MVIVDNGIAQVLVSVLGEFAEGEKAEWGLSACGMDDWRLTRVGANEDWGLPPGLTLLLKTGEGVKGSSLARISGVLGGIEENDGFGRVLLTIVSPLKAGFYRTKSVIKSQASFTAMGLTGGTKVSSVNAIDTG